MEGQRNQMNEEGLSSLAGGKIVKEVYLGLVRTPFSDEGPLSEAASNLKCRVRLLRPQRL